MRSTLFLARSWLSLVFDIEVVTSMQLSAGLRLIGHRWTSLTSRRMTQSTILNSSSTKPNSNIVTQLIRKIKARVSSQQKEHSVKIPVQRSQSIYLNPSVNGLCQNCSYKLMTECRAHDTVIMSQVNILDPHKMLVTGRSSGAGPRLPRPPGEVTSGQATQRHGAGAGEAGTRGLHHLQRPEHRGQGRGDRHRADQRGGQENLAQ